MTDPSFRRPDWPRGDFAGSSPVSFFRERPGQAHSGHEQNIAAITSGWAAPGNPVGPSLRARTTEEISSDAVVKEALGEDNFASLIRLLSTADHWKFASPPENGQTESLLEELPQWSSWQGTLPGLPKGKR
jgi:hypothetical protein